MKDGGLLKVSRPAMSLDSTLLHRAFGSGGPKGNMTAAFTEVQVKPALDNQATSL